MPEKTNDQLIREAAPKIIEACAAKSFNRHHKVRPWDDSKLSLILKPLPKKVAERLLFDTAVRAIEFRRDYGCSGSKHFRVLLQHHTEMHSEVEKPKLTKKNYWSVVDICAVNTLIPGGQRIGDVQLNLYSEKGIKN